MARASSHPRSRQARRQADTRHERDTPEYEGGHAAPFEPDTPEISQPDSPAVDEIEGRDEQDGLTEKRRKRRDRGSVRRGRGHGRIEPTVH